MTEKDVQIILKGWFQNIGYSVEENTKLASEAEIDLIARNQNEEWVVEVKGDYDSSPAQYNVNFDTGIGQLMKSITRLHNKTKYAIAIPFSRTEEGKKFSYRQILPKYSKSIVFEALNIHLLLVRDDKSVEVIEPSKVRTFLSSIDPRIRNAR
jgi:hypothetical protein